MATTVTQLVEETKRLLYGAGRMTLNRTAGAVGSADTTVTCEFDLNDAARNSFISIDDEIMYVLSANVSAKQLTVIRGYLGTTAATHALGALIEVNARFPRVYIKRALQQEIDSWGTRLYKVTASNISFDSTTRIYDLGISNFIAIIDARVSPYPGRTTRSNPYRWTVLRDQDTTVFPSGSAFEFLGDTPPTGVVRIKAAQKFDVSTWADNTDVEATIGLTTAMCAIPPVGAAWRLMSAKEIGRTNLQAQPEPRRAEESPAGHAASVAAQLKKLRDDLIDEERWTLMNRYPLKGVA